jgi:CheY-like chemotaxis protein/anti-sigma regulatory factor (Ser/Thr protein kinase)
LLTFAGRQTLDISAVDVNDLVQEVAPDGPWRGGEVRIEHDLDPGLAPCRIDRDRAASAISELLVNALEAVPEGGVVRLATANVVDAGGHGLVEISVSDNGPGMEPDVLAQAIEPFFTTKSFGGSAGLGLGTVYGFVMQSDGSFLLESEPGRGTVARLRFPADRSDAAAETITLQTTGTTGRVLLVDEDDMVRESTAQILAMLGLSVVAASSAEAAADAAAADRFDVLVVDVSLGARLDGVGLIERLREHSPEPGVVVISGFAPDQLDLSRLAGPYEFLPKPFTVSEVTGALRRAGRPVG